MCHRGAYNPLDGTSSRVRSPARRLKPIDVTLLNFLVKQRYVDRFGLGLVGRVGWVS